MDDFYKTIATVAEIEIKIKGSRFIGRVWPVANVESAQEILNGTRKKEYAATHNCYAYTVGLNNDLTFKYSDDGEPSGTAGKPIYDMIKGSGLSNSLVIVTRYYGGTKLGTGGLVRAYGSAASEAIEKSGIQTIYLTDFVKVVIEFPLYNQLLKLVESLAARIVNSDFSDKVKVEIEIRKSKSDRLVDSLIDLSGGKAEIEKHE